MVRAPKLRFLWDQGSRVVGRSLESSIFDLLHRLAHLVLWPKMVQTVIKVRLAL